MSDEARKLTVTCLAIKAETVTRIFRLLREVSLAMQPSSNGDVLTKIIKLENILRELVEHYRIEKEPVEYVSFMQLINFKIHHSNKRLSVGLLASPLRVCMLVLLLFITFKFQNIGYALPDGAAKDCG